MGLSSTLVGCLPTKADIGAAAGGLLIFLRICEGLAIGGEYGGAVTFVAEYSPRKHRGFYTSFIQCTASLGLLIADCAILLCKAPNPARYDAYAWRFPFLLCFPLILLSLYVRIKMHESPIYLAAQRKKIILKNPLYHTFCVPSNLYYVCLAFFGATMGQGALWYSAQFYAQTFLESTLLINYQTVYGIVCIAVIFASPFFVVFGHLSDVYGRKVFIIGGLVLGAALLYPLFMGMAVFAPYQVINDKVVKNAVNGNASNVMICFLVWVGIVLVTMVSL